MNKVLDVIWDFRRDRVTARLLQLVHALPRAAFESRVAVMGKAEPFVAQERSRGVAIETLGRGRWIDLQPLVRLRGILKEFAPRVIHAWGWRALRSLAFSGWQGPIIASPCLEEEPGWSPWRWLARRRLRRARWVLAYGAAEAKYCRTWGVAREKTVEVTPATAKHSSAGPAPLKRKYILCVGRLEPHKGFLEAIWAFDMLRYVHDDLDLVIAGTGPDRERLLRFQAQMGLHGHVHFPGDVADVGPWMHHAEIVWSPGRVDTGTQVVLEAMTAGKPVVASRFPQMSELIVDGETGYLVRPEDKSALARAAQRLLTDSAMKQRFGTAAMTRVNKHFRIETLAERTARLYKE